MNSSHGSSTYRLNYRDIRNPVRNVAARPTNNDELVRNLCYNLILISRLQRNGISTRLGLFVLLEKDNMVFVRIEYNL